MISAPGRLRSHPRALPSRVECGTGPGPRRGSWILPFAGWSVRLDCPGPEGHFLPRLEPAVVVKVAPRGRKWLWAVYFGCGLADGAGGRRPGVRRAGLGSLADLVAAAGLGEGSAPKGPGPRRGDGGASRKEGARPRWGAQRPRRPGTPRTGLGPAPRVLETGVREDGVKVGPPLGCSSRERDVGTRQGSEAAGAAREQRGAGSPQRLEAIWGLGIPRPS